MSNYASILRRNVAASVIRYCVIFAIAFFLTPYIINKLGDKQYGIWVLVYSFVGYAGIFELGIMPATVKLVSQYANHENSNQRNAIANTALIFYMGLGVIACVMFWTILIPIMYSMINKSIPIDELTTFSRIVGLDAFINFLSFPIMGIVYGLHQYHKQSQRDIVIGLANLAGSLYILYLGFGLLGLAWVRLGLSIFGLIILIFFCKGSLSQIKFSFHYISRSAFIELFKFGFSIFIMQTMTRINNYAIPTLITIIRNVAMTAYFNVAQTLVGRLMELLWSISAPFMPVFSEIYSKKKLYGQIDDSIRSIYLKGSRIIIACSIPLYIGLFLLGPNFLGVWISPIYEKQAGIALRILVLEMSVIGLQPLIQRIMVGQGHVKSYNLILTIGNILGFIFLICLIFPYGIEGVAISCLARSLIIQVSLLKLLRRKLFINVMDYIRVCIFPWFYAAVSQIFCLLIASKLIMLDSFTKIIAAGAISILPYSAFAYFSFNISERNKIVNSIMNVFNNLKAAL